MDWKFVILISLAILAGLYFIYRDTLSKRFPKFFTPKLSNDDFFGDSDPNPEPSVQRATPNRTERRTPPKVLKTNCLRQYREMKVRPFALAAECTVDGGGRECIVFFCGDGEEIEESVVDILERAHWISAISPSSDYHRTACKPHFEAHIEELRARRHNAERAGTTIVLDEDDRVTIEFFRSVFFDDWTYFVRHITEAIGVSLNRAASTTELFHAFLAKPNEKLEEVRQRTRKKNTTMTLQAIKDNKRSAAVVPTTEPDASSKPQQKRSMTQAWDGVLPLAGMRTEPEKPPPEVVTVPVATSANTKIFTSVRPPPRSS